MVLILQSWALDLLWPLLAAASLALDANDLRAPTQVTMPVISMSKQTKIGCEDNKAAGLHFDQETFATQNLCHISNENNQEA